MNKPKIRRDKSDPCTDFWHTLRWGAVFAIPLFLVLNWLFG